MAVLYSESISDAVHESSHWMIVVYYVWSGILLAAALVALAGLHFPGKGKQTQTSKHVGFYLSFAINFVACLAYYAMGGRIGRVFVDYDGTAWEVYFARYIDWSITTPLLLTHLIIFAGLKWQQWVFVLINDFGMIVTGLIGNLTVSNTKWGWFAAGCLFQVIVALELAGPARKNAFSRSKRAGGVYTALLGYLLLVWLLYPVVWILDIGAHVISPDAAGLWYAILDLLAKPIFTAVLFVMHLHLERHHEDLDHKAPGEDNNI